jgi:hypothetical protein
MSQVEELQGKIQELLEVGFMFQQEALSKVNGVLN